MKTNFVLIDLENLQPVNCGLLTGIPLKVRVFVGANQSKISLELAQAVQSLGPDAEYIQIDGNGSNALDFHIAYYIGHLSLEFPGSFFHIISKDAGFDPLIKYLKSRKILCKRSTTIADIPLVRIEKLGTLPEQFAVVSDHLAENEASRPRTVKALINCIKARFLNQLPDPEVSKRLEHLAKTGIITVDGSKVIYQQP